MLERRMFKTEYRLHGVRNLCVAILMNSSVI